MFRFSDLLRDQSTAEEQLVLFIDLYFFYLYFTVVAKFYVSNVSFISDIVPHDLRSIFNGKYYLPLLIENVLIIIIVLRAAHLAILHWFEPAADS